MHLAVTEVLGQFLADHSGWTCTGEDIPPCLMEAAVKQDRIGWDWTLQGKLSRRWQDLQHQWLLERGSRQSAQQWVADLSSHLLTFTQSLWTTQNSIIHEWDEDGLLMEEGHQLCQAIEEQFILGDREMNSHGCSLLDLGQDQVLAMRVVDRKRWLQAVMLEREVVGHRGAQEQSHMQAAMESWLESG